MLEIGMLMLVVMLLHGMVIRLINPIDTPGHAGSWCKGHPEVCPSPTCTQPLNPATDATFDLLAGLFKDVTGGAAGQGLFPDNMFHLGRSERVRWMSISLIMDRVLGGDEVNTDCWTSTPSVAAWLKAQGFTADQGYEYFVNRTQVRRRFVGSCLKYMADGV
jgi:hexosaminidase